MNTSATNSNLKITIDVDPTQMYWPSDEECAGEYGLSGNRDYCDLRDVTSGELKDIYSLEAHYIDQFRNASSDEKIEQIYEDMLEDFDWPGLDAGVASTVFALSVTGCIPATSCNGGVLENAPHYEDHPLVVFFSRKENLPILLDSAKSAKVGLDHANGGALIVYADGIEQMIKFSRLISQKTSYQKYLPR